MGWARANLGTGEKDPPDADRTCPELRRPLLCMLIALIPDAALVPDAALFQVQR